MNQTETNIALPVRRQIPAAASNKNNQGFTLLELFLYISIMATVLTTAAIFFFLTLWVDAKNQAIVEVEQQGAQMMQRITHEIRNAESILSPLPGQSSALLSLNTGEISASDFVFAKVSLVDLNFTNLSKSNTPGVIRIQFTLTYQNKENRQEYNYSQTFYDSASLRKK